MKLFKFLDFTKDGKGIEKDAPQKRAFFRFWSRFWEKRYRLIGANFLYLPSAIISLFVEGDISETENMLLYLARTISENVNILDSDCRR